MLDQDLLNGESNPFRSDFDQIEKAAGAIGNVVELYINDTSDLFAPDQSQRSVPNSDFEHSYRVHPDGQQGRHTLPATFLQRRTQDIFSSSARNRHASYTIGVD